MNETIFSLLVTMADERRAMGSRTGDSKKEVECGICTNPPFPLETSRQALQVHMVALLQCLSSIMLCIYIFLVKYIASVHEFLLFLFVGLNFSSLFCKFLTILDFTHICREFVDVAIYALCPESFCVKNPAVRKVFAFSDSGHNEQ